MCLFLCYKFVEDVTQQTITQLSIEGTIFY